MKAKIPQTQPSTSSPDCHAAAVDRCLRESKGISGHRTSAPRAKRPAGFWTLLVLAGTHLACTQSTIDPEIVQFEPPTNWHQGTSAKVVSADWLSSFGDPELTELVVEAFAQNRLLAQERAILEQSEKALVIAGADKLPSVDLQLTQLQRGGEAASGGESQGQVDLSWEIDLWGRLGTLQQKARLELAAQRAKLETTHRQIAADIAGAFFNALEAKEQVQVAEKRLENARLSREVVANGYSQGLNEALDFYLAKSRYDQEQAALADQRQRLVEAIIELQLTLGRYPDGKLNLDGRLPVIEEVVSVGVPSELLTRRADIQEAWLRLMAADMDAAVAHKNRFPRITLSGTAWVDGAGFSWSALGSLVQPLFQGGRLAALEEQAVARVRQTEQLYLDTMFIAFSQVESALHRATTLHRRYVSYLEAEQNAIGALNLALEQYQRGLVSYTTVLESQRQAFDASTTVIQLRNALLQNRIALHIALGGELAFDGKEG